MNLNELIVFAENYVAQQKSQPQQDKKTKSNVECAELILSQLLIVRNGGKITNEFLYVLSDGFDTNTVLANELMAFYFANPHLKG
jgi:hypothetical protein